MKVFLNGLLFISMLTLGYGIRWHMKPNTEKCLKEELRQNVLVKGEYEVTPAQGQRVDYVVSWFMNLLWIKEILPKLPVW